MNIIPPAPILPITDKDGIMSQIFRTWVQLVSNSTVIIGSGSPEGVVSANQGRQYMDSSGIAGAILYIKRDPDIGGDTKQGWILV